MTSKIACSPLTGRIYSGRIDAKRGVFVGEKRDVTSDVMGALIEKAKYHGGTFEIQGSGRKWDVKVVEVTSEGLTP